MLAADIALFGLDKPFAILLLRDVGGAAAADDPGTLGAGTGGKRLGDARRVGMAILGRVERPQNTVQIVNG